MDGLRYPIKLAARESGLSEYVVRIWEQRYGAVEPDRTETNRRLYTPEQVDRLRLLRELTQAGHPISRVAKLPTEELRELVLGTGADRNAPALLSKDTPGTEAVIDDCLKAIKSLNGQSLDAVLLRGETALGGFGLLQRVVAPLVQTIGELWRQGELTAAHEHFATAALRVFLGNASKPFGSVDRGPAIVIATPAGQVHEMGALLASATSANLGWRVSYLGPSLPAAEIAGAAQERSARAVALSLVYPEDDPEIEFELKRLRQALSENTALLVGGRAAPAYGPVVESVGAILIKDLEHFGSVLEKLRKVPKTKSATRSSAHPASSTEVS
jgi:DNA-binding transcriptional MerR regulator/methylmalonyl-CoA mutase cobalamin-binding subunit